MFNTSIIERDPSAGFNGSFEKVIHGLPANWTIYASSDYQKNYLLSYDAIEFKEGKHSLKFEVHSVDTSNVSQAWRRPGISQRIEAKPSDKYRVSFWLKNSGCEFKVKVGVSGGGIKMKNLVSTKKDFAEWTYFEQDYTVPEHFPFFRFELNILSPGTFWIDDVRIDKVPE